jgi:alkylhydroperoxidase family enzyme
MTRIAPLEMPYPPDAQKAFDAIMPPGVPPLVLFTTLARNPHIFERFRAGRLLDKGCITLRDREIVIDRVTARCGSEYEWGVHIAFFAERAGLSPEQIAATVRGTADDPVWAPRDSLLIRLVDALHDDAAVSDELWSGLAAEFSDEQLLELIVLTGFYHTVSFVTNALRLPLEPYAVRFPK